MPEAWRNAGRGDGFATLDLAGDFQVQGEELGERVFLGGEALGGEDDGVQGGMGVFEGIGAGQFERAVEAAQAGSSS